MHKFRTSFIGAVIGIGVTLTVQMFFYTEDRTTTLSKRLDRIERKVLELKTLEVRQKSIINDMQTLTRHFEKSDAELKSGQLTHIRDLENFKQSLLDLQKELKRD